MKIEIRGVIILKRFNQIIKNDFKNYIKYGIFQTILVIALLFSLSMVFLPQVNPLILIYITIFIIPVIIFSISIYIENEEKTLFPLTFSSENAMEIILAKITSALILLIIPMIAYILVMQISLHMNYNVFLFILIYLLAAIMHIVIGIVLAVISKSNRIMSISYIGYIVLFSLTPIFYAEGLVPDFFEYILVISPAYLSGVLFEQVIVGYIHAEDWLLLLAIVLQFVYIFLLTYFVLKPYFKSYLYFRINQEGENLEK